jgi:hypothetical protein
MRIFTLFKATNFKQKSSQKTITTRQIQKKKCIIINSNKIIPIQQKINNSLINSKRRPKLPNTLKKIKLT